VTELVVGILVGGRGSRLGGVAKGLLTAPDSRSTLIERLLVELAAALPEAPIALLGQAEGYQALGLPALVDNPPGVGPLGGIVSLLEFAEQRGAPAALSLSCDLPRIERAVLSRLASEEPRAAALVTVQAGVRNPLVARYAVAPALPAARRALHSGSRSVQAVLDALGDGVATLRLTAAEEASLADWDVPEDLL
jgi:molybdopterin-guanine dinucleotide biosynthesis protein A